jgi:hypothetical protein
MAHVTAAQEADLAAVQKSMQQVSAKSLIPMESRQVPVSLMVLLAWGSSVFRALLTVVFSQSTVTVRATARVRAASSMHSGMAILRSSLGAKWVTEPPFLDADSVENGASIEAWGTLRN